MWILRRLFSPLCKTFFPNVLPPSETQKISFRNPFRFRWDHGENKFFEVFFFSPRLHEISFLKPRRSSVGKPSKKINTEEQFPDQSRGSSDANLISALGLLQKQ
ncbi:hypothetical protein CDAR_397301 [Caerostris darwini]|uniref:Uncharacterized protein n=1 Tax=Caerostris darwini TaxID=1538125 RepID=A0AAV4WQM9_9ARAC|nr:hypothetical protein CDAR_397301 [Caerostris darwini]